MNPEKQRRKLAKRHVDKMPEELVSDLAPYLLVIRGLHLGTNARGERISPAERTVLETTRDSLRKQLIGKYTPGGDDLDLSSFLTDYSVNKMEVKKEIISRGE